MGEDEREPGDEPWEVNEYRYEPPLWMKALFSPWFGGVGAPLALLLVLALWRCRGG